MTTQELCQRVSVVFTVTRITNTLPQNKILNIIGPTMFYSVNTNEYSERIKLCVTYKNDNDILQNAILERLFSIDCNYCYWGNKYGTILHLMFE